MSRYGVLLDNSVIINYCLGKTDDNSFYQNEEFFNYLEQHPRPLLGLVTLRTRYNVREKLNEKLRYRSSKSRCKGRLDDLRNFASTTSVNPTKFRGNLIEVDKFFSDFIEKNKDKNNDINLNQISPAFQSVIKDAYNCYPEKVFLKRPEPEDRELLAEAVCLSKKYDPLFLVSFDEHFSGDLISKAIEETFKIKSGWPKKLLPRIKEYEQSLLKKN